MAQDPDIRLLTSPRIFLVGMAAFLALVGFVVLILYQQIALAFSANPGLNGLILGVLAIGALFTFRQVIRLFREIHWVNSLTGAVTDGTPPAPILLAPMAVMRVSFPSSLFGLASSLILGFLDLQAGQAQNRFYSEFEEFLASHVQTTPAVEAVPDAPIIGQGAQPVIEYQRDTKAIATLAEGIQALVGHMRTEQQQIRDWVDAQATQQEDIGKLLRRLLDELGAR